jgi:hypothetical protein
MPPMKPGEPDARQRMAIPRVVVIESRPDGVSLDRFDESGASVGDTWHESIDDAKAQAWAEYAENFACGRPFQPASRTLWRSPATR